MAVIELVEELQVAATTQPARKTARKATAQQNKVEALAREDEAPVASAAPVAQDETPAESPAESSAAQDEIPAESSGAQVEDQDAEPPVNASGDKGAEGPGDQAEGEDTDDKA
jgi:large subunit ribosomal protein L17